VLSPRAPAVLFVALLTAYSVQWMYVIRHLPPVALGMEAHLRPAARALVVDNVSPDGAALDAGIRPGDLITAINGQTVETQAPYFALRSDAKPGVPVRLSVQHDGATRDIVFTPRVRPDVPPGFAST